MFKSKAIEIHLKAIGEENTKFVKSRLAELGFQVNQEFSRNSGILEELFLERL